MILADRIVELRKKHGWSQEELAEMVDVTRQSVSKWESNQSVPDLDKILKLADIFEVSTDYLLRAADNDDERIHASEEDKETYTKHTETKIKERLLTDEEVRGFLEVKRETAPKIALGVSLCILSPIMLILLAGAAEYGVIGANEDRMAMLGIIILILMIASAMVFFIPAGIKISKYEYIEKEPITVTPEMKNTIASLKEEFQPEFTRKISLGVCLCILSVIPLFIVGVILDPDDGYHFVVALALLLIIVSAAVNIFIRAGVKQECYETLLEEGDFSREDKDKILDAVSTVYWLIITAAYLTYSLITFRWEISWVIWPVAGIIYAIIREIYKAVKSAKNK